MNTLSGILLYSEVKVSIVLEELWARKEFWYELSYVSSHVRGGGLICALHITTKDLSRC